MEIISEKQRLVIWILYSGTCCTYGHALLWAVPCFGGHISGRDTVNFFINLPAVKGHLLYETTFCGWRCSHIQYRYCCNIKMSSLSLFCLRSKPTDLSVEQRPCIKVSWVNFSGKNLFYQCQWPMASLIYSVYNTANVLWFWIVLDRKCHILSFIWCFGYLVFFRTTHYFGLPMVPPHSNAVQLLLTLKVSNVFYLISQIYQILNSI